MNKWGIIVSTYGNSHIRLTKTLESITYRTKVPFDLWVRGASEDYWQECRQREVAEKFGAKFMESARWRYWEPARSFRVVKNPYLAYCKDDIVMGYSWLEAMDCFWENNPELNIGSVGWTLIEAWELINAKMINIKDDIWKDGLCIERADFNKHVEPERRMHDPRFPAVLPALSDCACPVAWTLKREDFVNFNGFYYVGSGDNYAMYGHLCLKNEKLVFNIPYPTLLHRGGTSTEEFIKRHQLKYGLADAGLWSSDIEKKDYERRWGKSWEENQKLFTKKMIYLRTKIDCSKLNFTGGGL